MNTTSNLTPLEERTGFMPVSPDTYNDVIRQFNEFKRLYGAKERELSQLQGSYSAKERELSQLQELFDTYKEESEQINETLENSKNDLSDTVNTLTGDLKTTRKITVQLNNDLQAATSQIEQTRKAGEDALAQYKSIVEKQSEAREGVIKQLQGDLDDKIKAYSSLEIERDDLHRDVQTKGEAISKLTADNHGLVTLMDKEYNPISAIVPEVVGGTGEEAYWDLMSAVKAMKSFEGKTSVNASSPGAKFQVSVDIGDTVARVERQVYCNGVSVSLNGYQAASADSSEAGEATLDAMKSIYTQNKARVAKQKSTEKLLASSKDPKKVEQRLNELDSSFKINASVDYESVAEALELVHDATNRVMRVYQISGNNMPDELVNIAQTANRWYKADMTETNRKPSNSMIAFEASRQVYLNENPTAEAAASSNKVQKSIYEILDLEAGKLI